MRIYTRFKAMRPRQSGPEWPYWLLALALIAALVWFWRQPQEVVEPAPQQPAKQAQPKPTLPAIAQLNETNRPATNALVVPRPALTNLTATNSLPAGLAPTNTAVAKRESPTRFQQAVLDAQLALARRGISAGSHDGVIGSQTRAAIRAFQRMEGLPESGELDAPTRERLKLNAPAYTTHTVLAEDLERLLPLSDTWLGKSQQPRLDYETILELVAEKAHAHPNLIRLLNPQVDWTNVVAGTELKVPNAALPPPRKAALIRIQLAAKTLTVLDDNGRLIAHFPCSIARRVEKRPVGELHVAVLAVNPNYTFNPEIFPESAEARTIKNKLILQPGPNNPVGSAWIGLDMPGYGIHGTPRPEEVGRTESHGCFRLANWNAEWLAKMVWIGLPVLVEP